jgi:hypothetical protein
MITDHSGHFALNELIVTTHRELSTSLGFLSVNVMTKSCFLFELAEFIHPSPAPKLIVDTSGVGNRTISLNRVLGLARTWNYWSLGIQRSLSVFRTFI